MLQVPTRLHALRNMLLLGLLAGLAACSGTAPAVRLEDQTTASGQQHSVFYPQGLAIRVLTTRPDVADRTIQLSVAGAYTDLDTDRPLDLLVANGQELQPTAKVGFLDGVLTIIGDSLTISRIPKGQSPPGATLARVRQQHGTLLLQELLVFGGRSVRAAGAACSSAGPW